jgi:hypothetical protein
MIITIEPQKKLAELSDAFSAVYPFLKLEFFSRSHGWLESSDWTHMLNKNMTITEANNNQTNSGYIEIHYWQKTGIVEMKFLKQFNLAVQIYRKLNDHWIQTSGTDDLSLEEQNESGMLSLKNNIGHARFSDLEKDI